MGKREIIFTKDNWYHVWNEGKNKQSIFLEHEDYGRFLETIVRYQESPKYKNIGIPSYCLLPDHFHMIIYEKGNPKGVSRISEFMQQLQLSYAMAIKAKYKRMGQIFAGRFGAEEIEKERRNEFQEFVEYNAFEHFDQEISKTWPYTSREEERTKKVFNKNIFFGRR